ncbi:MAG: MBL fold metallo-hydrolase, partial [Treponemataceae bacterium]|nr:MBL fold metallo-hydrolase [Treponemataceae bacterium]
PTEFGAAGNVQFHTLPVGRPFQLGPLKIDVCRMRHPGSVHAFAFTENGRKLVYATDIELSEQDVPEDAGQAAVFQDADCILIDSQYTAEDALRHKDWGHSSFNQAVDFASRWNIGRMYLFHHEPTYDDKKLASVLEAARSYAAPAGMEVYLAVEGEEFEL